MKKEELKNYTKDELEDMFVNLISDMERKGKEYNQHYHDHLIPTVKNKTKDVKELNEIKYRFVIDLTKFFLSKYNEGEIKDLNSITRNVLSLSKFLKEITFVYDETMWFPNKPDTHKNLIEFKIQLYNELGYLPFRLFINKGINQEPILLNGSMMWEW